jgi:hypothetical protein
MCSAMQVWRSTSRVQPRSVASAMRGFLGAQSFPQPGTYWGVVTKLGAGQVDVALARAFLGKAQTAAQFQFGLVELVLSQSIVGDHVIPPGRGHVIPPAGLAEEVT